MKKNKSGQDRIEEIKRTRTDGFTDLQIGKKFGISRERVAQLAGRRIIDEALLVHFLKEKKRRKELNELARRKVFLEGADREAVGQELGIA
jgi:hypothetical protein